MATQADTETQGDQVEAVETAEIKEEDPNKIKKKQIYDHVTVATGLRKREVRESVDATLAYFFKCLDEGKDLHIPPLGKIRSIERGDGENAKMHYKVILQKPKSEEKLAQEAKEALEAESEGQ